MPYRPLAAEAGHIHICAHRGHSIGAPENTLPALRAAAMHGATVAEIDVVLTRDEQIVLLHDEILDRTTNGKGRVSDMDLAAIKRLDAGSWFAPTFASTRIPTLGEALATARAEGMGLLVEIKERTRRDLMLERLGRLLESEDASGDCLVISFDHVALMLLKERFSKIRTELITHARHVDPAAMACRAHAASVSIEWDMFHAVDAEALHAAGVAVRVTLPRPEVLELRRSYGFDDQGRLMEDLNAGKIDALAGDDTVFIRNIVKAAND